MNTQKYSGIIQTGKREEWILAADTILRGIFKHVHGPEEPVVYPRKEYAVSYPHRQNSEREKQAERFEALVRTFLLASVRIREDRELTVNGIRLCEYFRAHILRACSASDKHRAGRYAELIKSENNKNAVFQQTVEAGLLTIGLWTSREVIWDTYTKDEKEEIVTFLKEYAYGNTVNQNWRLFNLLILAFLKMTGYEQDREYIRYLLTEVLLDYAGDGWYRDGQTVDYYSCWSYQLFLPLFCLWYGYAHEQAITKTIEDHSNELMKHYPDLFDDNGHMILWGRSCIYRCASSVPMIANLLLKDSTADPGEAHRVCTGTLKQFLDHPDTFNDDVLTLGFYGQFTPAVQPYSCAASPGWMFLVFLCLVFPMDHPFWHSQEPEKPADIRETFLDGPGLAVTRHPENSSVLLRTGRILLRHDDQKGMWNYSRLCFHSQLPWEKTLKSGSETMQYSLYDSERNNRERMNVIFWAGEQNGVLYRRGLFNASMDRERHWTNNILLADITVPYGMLRLDMPQLLNGSYELSLGSFGFPYELISRNVIKKQDWTAIILKGEDSAHRIHTMAVTLNGEWSSYMIEKSRDTSALNRDSVTVIATRTYGSGQRRHNSLLISQILTAEDDHAFTEEELFPVRRITQEPGQPYLSHVQIRDKEYTLDYSACMKNTMI